jgi:hydrogenase nickel incorporation protein HypB
MCDTCGCNITDANRHLIEEGGAHAHTPDGRAAVTVLQGLLSENDRQAAHNREHFDEYGVLAVNLMSSPGSGKTSLLEATISAVGDTLRIGVIEGDLETENDAERIRSRGVPALQITTGSACHLDAHMIHHALHDLRLGGLDVLFIENVGNLVCPASFDLGQHLNVVLLSVTEGDDKPSKYPVMFRAADAVLLSKADLLPHLDDFAPARAEQGLRALASAAPLLRISARDGEGMEAWLEWLRRRHAEQAARPAAGAGRRPEAPEDGGPRHQHDPGQDQGHGHHGQQGHHHHGHG